MVIQATVFTMKKSIDKDYRWIFMVIMKVVVFVKIVNTIPKVSIVTNANRNSIDHTENTGMKPMCADVRFFFFFDFICSNFLLLKFFFSFFTQIVIAIYHSQLVIVKKKQDAVNADQNSKSQIVDHVHLVILAIQIVDHANVISMVQMVTTVNHRMANVHVNQILLVIIVNDALMVSMDQNVYLVNVI